MRIAIWNLHIDIISLNQILEIVENNIRNFRKPIKITGINPEIVIKSLKDEDFREAINLSDIVNIDGVSIAIALRIMGYSGVKRITCPDIFDALLDLANANGYKIYFLGAKECIINEMIRRLLNEYPNIKIVGYHHGYFNEKEEYQLINNIKTSGADMLFLGMSSPKKEFFITKHLKYMNVPLNFGVGGVFDIKAGLYRRAPKWMQRIGLEWLFRLIQEPKRLIQRQIGIYKFFFLLFKTLLSKTKSRFIIN
jgi:N-acetylglucosaminyldiphosphoundecaprenol N-acetyl-beta-D-mannosaminyltransferase